MRCRACDVVLTDFESTRKSVKTGEYIDMCDKCFQFTKAYIEVEEREDLRSYEELAPHITEEDIYYDDEDS